LPRRMEEGDPLLVRLARRLYAPVLRVALRHRLAVIALAIASLVVAGMIARGLGTEFVPRLSEGAFVVGITRLPGTSLEESLRYNTRMEQTLLAAFPDEVKHVWSRCGTAEVATDPMGPEETVVYDFCHEVIETGQASDASFKAVVDKFGERGAIDLIGVMGYYSLVSMVLNVDRVPIPEGGKPPLASLK